MAKIKLNLDSNEPLTYKRTVLIPTEDGKALKIEFTFKHRDRIALAKLFDEYIGKARAAAEEVNEERPLVESAEAGIRRDIETVLDIADSWNVDLPFDELHLGKFFRRYPGAATAIATDYRVSLAEGRLGN